MITGFYNNLTTIQPQYLHDKVTINIMLIIASRILNILCIKFKIDYINADYQVLCRAAILLRCGKQLHDRIQCRIYHCAYVCLSTGPRWPGRGAHIPSKETFLRWIVAHVVQF